MLQFTDDISSVGYQVLIDANGLSVNGLDANIVKNNIK